MRKHPLQHHIDTVLEEIESGDLPIEMAQERLEDYQSNAEIYQVALTIWQMQQSAWRRHPVLTRVLLFTTLMVISGVPDLLFHLPLPGILFEMLPIGFFTWRPEFILDDFLAIGRN